ncbi:septum site-determining protein MinC [Buchnera aphidicola]|uniref:septum site-determining protein MinC n=1 Tax=Buchnera aphidicola TaxID=9 RepID=UPI002237D87B|nr:septum site-determining protein MinC [Buchnera aphidicola]MCW5197725.1 septum site-determining protein MinC [Buchnera aphidicola (Chaitophorus viminalis)]
MNVKSINIPIKLQGSIFTTLVLYICSNNINLINNALQKKVQKSPDFFYKAPIILNLSLLPKNSNWKKIQKIIFSNGFLVIGVIECYDSKLKKKILNSGVPIFSNKKNFIQKYTKISKQKKFKSVLYNHTIRSGQTIYAKESDLIIINNVNKGSELIADGNIHVYGQLSGRALAGAHGDHTRKIFCQYLEAELLSISGEYCLIDSIPNNILNKPAQIYLKNHSIHIKKL